MQLSCRTSYYCDVCELEFNRESELVVHEDAHVVCELEGCTYVSCKEIMEEHILLVHASGLYARMARGSSKEEVEKWQSERKK